MRELTIWHNPRCSKSRQALALIQEAGRSVTLRHYLDEPPSADEIAAILQQLGLSDPRAMMRKGEALYKTLNLAAEPRPDHLISAMAAHPILIERPIISNGQIAVIGRPPERLQALLSDNAPK